MIGEKLLRLFYFAFFEARGDQDAKLGDTQSGIGSQPPSAEDQW